MSSFAGFLPAEDPQLSILVVIDEPRPKYHGGEIAAPVRQHRLLRPPPAAGAPDGGNGPGRPAGPGRAGPTTDLLRATCDPAPRCGSSG